MCPGEEHLQETATEGPPPTGSCEGEGDHFIPLLLRDCFHRYVHLAGCIMMNPLVVKRLGLVAVCSMVELVRQF